MARLDDRVQEELERAARPADPSGLYEQLIRRRERRSVRRRIQTGAVALVVVIGTIAGFSSLSRIFRAAEDRSSSSTTPANGVLGLTLFDAGFEAGERRTAHVFTLNPDGTGLTQLTSGDVIDTGVTWSPDGTQIAFWRVRTDRSGIWVAAADGSDPRVLLETQMSIHAIQWSPDGSRIAFVGVEVMGVSGTQLDFPTHLYVMTSDGADLTQLTDQGQVTDFAWAPDGDRFVVEHQFDAGNDRIGNDLWIVGVDGRDETPLTSDGVSSHPSWSPDGSTIVFIRSDPERFQERDLFAVAPDGSGLHQLTNDRAAIDDPTWSPDGTRLAFTRFPHGDGSSCELVVMSADGSSVATIGDKQTLGGCPVNLAWQSLPRSADVEPLPSESSTPSPSPSPETVQEDIGLGFLVCDVSSVRGRFAGTDTEGVAFVATRAGALGCPVGGDGFQLIAVDIDGDGVPDTSAGPLECQGRCSAFSAPDVDADGVDEVAVATGSTGGSTLFELYAVASESLLRLGYDCSRCNDGVFSWGRPGGHAEGAYCLPAGEVANFVSWNAERTDTGDQYAVAKIFIDVKGGFLTQVDRQDAFVPYDVASLPPGGGSDFCGSPVSVGEIAPTPSPTLADGGTDIGLEFPVCNVSSLEGSFFGDGQHQTAYVATRVSDTGTCPEPGSGSDLVAVDLAGDGRADLSIGPIGCELVCRVFSAPDVDGDGTSEILVAQAGGSVLGLGLYDVRGAGVPRADGPALVRVGVAEPGDLAGGFRAGRAALLWLGGDGFMLDTLRCGTVPAPDGPGIVATSAESLPHDSVDAVWHAHEVTLSLQSDGALHVVGARDFTEPVSTGPDGPSFGSGETLCGSNLGP